MKLVFLMSSLVGAFGADCAKGSMRLTDAQVTVFQTAKGTNGWCSKKEATSAATCNSGCCMADLTKCGVPLYNGAGLASTCDAGKYGGAAPDKATTVATYKSDCCVAVATCATSYGASAAGTICPAGKKYKASSAATKCTGDTTTCAALVSTCCELDVLKCGGLTVTCVSPKTSGNTRRRTSSDTWKNKATTEANKLTDCCTAMATCATAGYTCDAGYEKDTTKTTAVCHGQTGAFGSYSFDSCGYTCCKKDVTKCGGLMPMSSLPQSACASTHYYYSQRADELAAKSKTSTAATKLTDCCTTKAKCKAATCNPGYKMKATVAELDCESDALSCARGTTCCEKDVLKCGGLDSIVCVAGTYNECASVPKSSSYTTSTMSEDEKKAAKAAALVAYSACLNKAATDATKATACCTAKGKCSDFRTSRQISGQANATNAQMLPGTFLLVVLSVIGAVW